jgi:hypothetical protein
VTSVFSLFLATGNTEKQESSRHNNVALTSDTGPAFTLYTFPFKSTPKAETFVHNSITRD